MSLLLSPITIKDVTLRNRIVMSPMCQYSATDGFANDWHLVHYGSRATGGAGLIIQEATAVTPEGRITPDDLGIWKHEHIDMLLRITTFISGQGCVPGIQLAHAGRKAGCAKPWIGGAQLRIVEGGWIRVSSSDTPFNLGEEPPAALDGEGINSVIGYFGDAAHRALLAGYQVLEIHAAHGYLIHQFLSPLCNDRSDNYGGSFENRIRLLLEIVDAVKANWPDELPLFVRISTTDWVEGGWNADEAVKLAVILKTKGVDLIDASSGGMVPYAKIPLGPGYQVLFADRIRKETGIMTGAVGMITNPEQADEILGKGAADLIILGRTLLRDPYFPLNAARLLGDDIEWSLQYLRGKL